MVAYVIHEGLCMMMWRLADGSLCDSWGIVHNDDYFSTNVMTCPLALISQLAGLVAT
jgi:hypothetical protein